MSRSQSGIDLTPEQFRRGSTSLDWTAAVQLALDSAGPGGRVTLSNPAGYAVEDLSINHNDLAVTGNSRGGPTLEYKGDGVCLTIGTAATPRFRPELHNLRILGNAAAQTAIEVHSPEVVFNNVRIHGGSGFTRAGIVLDEVWSTKLVTCHITNCVGDGMQIVNGSTATMLAGCQFASNVGDNLWIHQAHGTSIIGSQFEAAGGYEIHVSDRAGFASPFALGLSIAGCYFETPTRAAARLLMIEGPIIGARFAMRDCYGYGMATAAYAVELAPTFGGAWGKIEDNHFVGFTTAHVRCATSLARAVVSGIPTMTGSFPDGAPLPLLDNTGGGRGSTITIGDLNTTIDSLRADRFGLGVAPIARPTGVPVTAAGIHAALVSLGLIAP